MNNLSCNVESCITNKNGGCCRPSIKVEGPAAGVSNETVCGSYQKKSGASNSNDAHYTGVNPCMDIACSAAACCYNTSGKCSSESVCIDCNCGCGERSACSTFRL